MLLLERCKNSGWAGQPSPPILLPLIYHAPAYAFRIECQTSCVSCAVLNHAHGEGVWSYRQALPCDMPSTSALSAGFLYLPHWVKSFANAAFNSTHLISIHPLVNTTCELRLDRCPLTSWFDTHGR